MKLVIIGGNSGTGALLAELARAQSHAVTVVSRSGSVTAHSDIRQVKGDATDQHVVAQAIAGADAVVITVGGSKGNKRARTDVTRAVVAAMAEEGPRRLLVQSSLGAGDSGNQLPGFIGAITKLLLAGPLADHSAQEEIVRASALDWNIVRPTGLSKKPGSGSWTALEVGESGAFKGTISRQDLAQFMLQLVTDPQESHKAYGVSAS